MIDPATKRSRGFGFICFLPGPEGSCAVDDALGQYQQHRIRGKWIEVKSAAPQHKLGAKGHEAKGEQSAGEKARAPGRGSATGHEAPNPNLSVPGIAPLGLPLAAGWPVSWPMTPPCDFGWRAPTIPEARHPMQWNSAFSLVGLPLPSLLAPVHHSS